MATRGLLQHPASRGRGPRPGAPLVPRRARHPTWLKWLSALAAINLLSFVLVAAYLGGDALNGYTSNSQYFLDWNGTYTEVSRSVYLYSKWHALSVIAVTAAAIFGWYAHYRARARRRR